MTRAELKAQAKAQIKGKIGILFIIYLVYMLVFGVISFIPVIGSIATTLLSPAFVIAIAAIYLGLTKGTEPSLEALFAYIKDFWSIFCVTFLVGLYTILWSLLLYVPGIIKGLSYSMYLYIKAENPEMKAKEVISESRRMMDGHKMELFVLYLSFIPWALLGAVTFGIAYIYIAPYMSATMANFYNSIKPVEHTYSAEYTEAVVTETTSTPAPQLEF